MRCNKSEVAIFGEVGFEHGITFCAVQTDRDISGHQDSPSVNMDRIPSRLLDNRGFFLAKGEPVSRRYRLATASQLV